MQNIKKAHFPGLFVTALVAALLIAILLVPLETISAEASSNGNFDPRALGSTLELHVSNDGKVIMHGLRVEQIAGSSFYCRMYWGSPFLRITLRTDSNTVVTKRFGQPITASDIAVGDYLSVDGEFVSGSNSFDVLAKKVKDWSIQTKAESFSGTITGIATSTPDSFFLTASNKSVITLAIGTSTIITRGSITVGANDLSVGRKVTYASGVFNNLTKTLHADKVVLFQDMSIFKPRNFEGKLKSGPSTNTLPTSLVVTVGGKDYTIGIDSETKILNAKKVPASLQRFLVGDKVRLYGSIAESNTSYVKAEILRNLDL